MPKFHLRKTNSPGSTPQTVDWIVSFDEKSGACISCDTLQGTPSPAFTKMNLSFLNYWVEIGKVDGVSYHEIVKDLTDETP